MGLDFGRPDTKKGPAGHYSGHHKEPPQPHGPKVRGKHPVTHSHSHKHHHARKLSHGKRSR